MKTFITKIVLLLIFLAVLICVLYIGNAGKQTENYLRAYEQKCKLLEEVSSPRIIFIGGSNLAFGLNSERIKDSLQMNVINYGLHAGMGLKYMIDDIALYAKEKDILVFAPEYSHFFGKSAYGESITLSPLLSCHPEKWNLLNFEQLMNVIKGMPNAIQSDITPFYPNERAYTSSGFNEYGDEVKHWELESIHIETSPRKENFNTAFAKYFMDKVNQLKNKCQLFIIPPVCIESYYQKNKENVEELARFLEKEGFPYLVSPDCHALPDDCGYDTHYHMNKKGVEIYTSSIIEILKEFL